jgi:hypothetical protein
MRASAWAAAAVLLGCGGSGPATSGSGSAGASKHALTIHIIGSGAVQEASFSCEQDCQQSLDGTVQLTAAAASGFTFSGWLGACSGAGDCSLAMSADTEVTATFTAVPPPPPPPPVMRTLTVAVSGRGTVTSSPSGISCTGNATCSAAFADGTQVTLTASTPGAQWVGACSGSGLCTLTLTADATVEATVIPPPPPDECAGVMPSPPGTPVTGVVDFSGQSSKTFCDTAISDMHGNVAGLLSGMGPHPWTVWSASGAKSAIHFDTNSVTAVALDSGFMGEAYDGTQRIEEVWGADGSLVTKEQPSASDAMTWFQTFPSATGGSVVLALNCWSAIHMTNAKRLQIGDDGTVVDMGGSDGCSLRWWPALLR